MTPAQAHSAVAQAIRSGNLTREACESCGSFPSVAHHDDYREPLIVRWLCRRHHRRWHAAHGHADGWSPSDCRIVTFKMSEQDYQELAMVAADDHRSVSAMIRLAISAYLDGLEKVSA